MSDNTIFPCPKTPRAVARDPTWTTWWWCAGSRWLAGPWVAEPICPPVAGLVLLLLSSGQYDAFLPRMSLRRLNGRVFPFREVWSVGYKDTAIWCYVVDVGFAIPQAYPLPQALLD